jgi:nitroreductase
MGFLDNLSWRYATKKFDGRKVPAEIFDKILEAIRMSPSAFGTQPYHITVIESDDLKKKLRPYAWDQEQITTCSYFLVFSADNDIDKRIDDYLKLASAARRADITDDPEYDYRKEAKNHAEKMGPEGAAKQAYIALGFALAACAELKIDSCPIEGFEPAAFKKILDLPENLEPKVLLAIGYRSSEEIERPKVRFGKEDMFDFRQ